MQVSPELLAGDAAGEVDEAHRLGIGEVAHDVVALGADHRQPAGDVLGEGAEGAEQDRQALALLGATDEDDAQLLAGGFGPGGAAARSTPLGMIS